MGRVAAAARSDPRQGAPNDLDDLCHDPLFPRRSSSAASARGALQRAEQAATSRRPAARRGQARAAPFVSRRRKHRSLPGCCPPTTTSPVSSCPPTRTSSPAATERLPWPSSCSERPQPRPAAARRTSVGSRVARAALPRPRQRAAAAAPAPAATLSSGRPGCSRARLGLVVRSVPSSATRASQPNRRLTQRPTCLATAHGPACSSALAQAGASARTLGEAAPCTSPPQLVEVADSCDMCWACRHLCRGLATTVPLPSPSLPGRAGRCRPRPRPRPSRRPALSPHRRPLTWRKPKGMPRAPWTTSGPSHHRGA